MQRDEWLVNIDDTIALILARLTSCNYMSRVRRLKYCVLSQIGGKEGRHLLKTKMQRN